MLLVLHRRFDRECLNAGHEYLGPDMFQAVCDPFLKDILSCQSLSYQHCGSCGIQLYSESALVFVKLSGLPKLPRELSEM